MTKASAHTAWGLFFTAEDLAEIPQPLKVTLLCSAWAPHLCSHAAASSILHATAMFAANGLRLPRFTSWILPFRYTLQGLLRISLTLYNSCIMLALQSCKAGLLP